MSNKKFNPMDYDLNGDGKISKLEAVNALKDYFAKKISKKQALEVIILYFLPKTASLHGSITDAETSSPLVQVKITADSQVTSSDTNGYYEFTGLSVGNHQVIFEKEGYEIIVK